MAYRKLKKECQKACRESYNSYLSSLLDDSTKSTKKFWTFLKSKKKDQFGIMTLEYQSKVNTDSLSKANLLNNQFVSVFTCEDLSYIPKMSENQVPDILMWTFK